MKTNRAKREMWLRVCVCVCVPWFNSLCHIQKEKSHMFESWTGRRSIYLSVTYNIYLPSSHILDSVELFFVIIPYENRESTTHTMNVSSFHCSLFFLSVKRSSIFRMSTLNIIPITMDRIETEYIAHTQLKYILI